MSDQNGYRVNGTCPLCDKPAFVRMSERIIGDNVICVCCGHYRIEHHALIGFEQQRYLLSGLTRRASTPKPTVDTRLTLTHENIPELLSASGIPRNLLDQLDITLEYAKEHQK